MTNTHSPASKSTIMVVDDNPEVVEIVRITLEAKGFTVKCAYNGKEVFAGLREQKSDLILLDIMMPKMDGLEVLNWLKENLSTSSIPVILVTTKVQYEEILGGYKTGAEYYITKLFTSTQVLEGVNLFLGGDQVLFGLVLVSHG